MFRSSFFKRKRCSKRTESHSLLKKYFLQNKKHILTGIFILLIVDLLEIFPPLILKNSIDVLTDGNLNKSSLPLILKYALLYLSVFFIQGLGRYGWRTYLIRSSFKAGRDLRGEFVSHLFKLPSSFYEKNSVGDLLSLANGDVESVRDCLGPGILTFADSVIYLSTIPLMMYYLDAKLTFIVLIPVFILPFVVQNFQKKIHTRYKDSQNHYSEMSAFSQESLNGIRVLKSFSKEETQLNRFKKEGEKYIQLNLKLARAQTLFGPLMDFFTSLGLVLLLYFGAQFILNKTLSLGTYVAFQGYLQKIVWPMIALGFSLSSFQRAKASEERLRKILDTNSEIKSGTVTAVNVNISPQLEIKNLIFSYPNDRDKKVLNNISFSVKKGMHVALIGPVASGKSTLLQLISRIYLATPNSIFLNGVDINEMELESLRQQFGVVTQELFLFSDTLRKNIAFRNRAQFPDENKLHERVMTVLRDAALNEDLSTFSKGLDTMIGERGVTLSGGQKQRVGIARALFNKPEILLFDDALSALDVKTEKKLLDALKKNTHSTLIYSTHRVSAAKEADFILFLDEGKVIERGSHEELIHKAGRYAELYQIQKSRDEALRAILEIEQLSQEQTEDGSLKNSKKDFI